MSKKKVKTVSKSIPNETKAAVLRTQASVILLAANAYRRLSKTTRNPREKSRYMQKAADLQSLVEYNLAEANQIDP